VLRLIRARLRVNCRAVLDTEQVHLILLNIEVITISQASVLVSVQFRLNGALVTI